MLSDLLAALALMLVFEGIMPFLDPSRFRNTLLSAARMSDRNLRTIGLACMLAGVILSYLVHRS